MYEPDPKLLELSRIIQLIAEQPNRRSQPNHDDPSNDRDFWFDGGSCRLMTGSTHYEFEWGAEAGWNLSDQSQLLWVRLKDGTLFSICNPPAPDTTMRSDDTSDHAPHESEHPKMKWITRTRDGLETRIPTDITLLDEGDVHFARLSLHGTNHTRLGISIDGSSRKYLNRAALSMLIDALEKYRDVMEDVPEHEGRVHFFDDVSAQPYGYRYDAEE